MKIFIGTEANGVPIYSKTQNIMYIFAGRCGHRPPTNSHIFRQSE